MSKETSNAVAQFADLFDKLTGRQQREVLNYVKSRYLAGEITEVVNRGPFPGFEKTGGVNLGPSPQGVVCPQCKRPFR